MIILWIFFTNFSKKNKNVWFRKPKNIWFLNVIALIRQLGQNLLLGKTYNFLCLKFSVAIYTNRVVELYLAQKNIDFTYIFFIGSTTAASRTRLSTLPQSI